MNCSVSFKKIALAHGAGGSAQNELLKIITSSITEKCYRGGVGLDELDDGGSIPLENIEIVFSADAHTVSPIFFPGGNIGSLAVAGTINDVLMMGARPLAISDTIVVEEGFDTLQLKEILDSMNRVAREAGVSIICGDFKVVPRGKLDQIIISTSGVGIVEKGKIIVDAGLRPGNKIILSGMMGDHGIAILASREGMEFDTKLISDSAPLVDVVNAALAAGKITAMKDPTRGGVAAALNEWAEKSEVSIWIDEESVPIRKEVEGACEMFGMDPFEITCEGCILIGVDDRDAENVLAAIRGTKHGKNASIIGEVRQDHPKKVILKTRIGGHRIIEMPYGEPIPRVC